MSKKKSKLPSNVIKFPEDRIVNKTLATTRDGAEAQELLVEAKKEWIDFVVRNITLIIFSQICNHGIDTSHDDFVKDLGYVMSAVTSAIRRHYGFSHPLQEFSDKMNAANPDGVDTMKEFFSTMVKNEQPDPENPRFA